MALGDLEEEAADAFEGWDEGCGVREVEHFGLGGGGEGGGD